MVYKADKLRLRKLLMDAISLLCKNGLPVQSAFRIEATIGITLSEDEVVLVSFREMVQPDGVTGPRPLSEDEASDEASSVLSHGDELDGDNTGKKDNMVEDRPSQAVRDGTRDESGAWCETGDAAFVGNSGHVGNFDLKRRSSVATDNNDNPNFPPLDVDAFSYDNTSSRLRPSGSSVDRFNHNNASSLDVSGRRSRFEVQIKDEIIDDDDCTFVKMEDGGDGGDAVFDPLVADDSFMYQVYNETNMYNAMGNELSQITQDYVDDTPGGGLAPGSNQSWTASPRSSQAYRGGSGAIRGGGGGATRGGARQSLPDASRSQDRSVARTLQSLCKTIASQACPNAPGEPVFCHICGARLSSNATLIKHIKGTHLALSACQCDICGQSFKWTMQLCRHRKRYHSNVAAVD